MVVTCESANGAFETGGRSESRDTETSDDEGLRDKKAGHAYEDQW
jgi:hypothetical protein